MADPALSLGQVRAGATKALFVRDYAGARRGYRELRRLLVEKFGEEHIHVAAVDEVLGGIERASGDRVAARAAFERSRASFRAHDDPRARAIDTTLAHLDPLDPDVLARRPRVRVEHDSTRWSVDYDLFYIGRANERVHLYIPIAMLSRIHARVLWHRDSAGNGSWLFEDCASENGSYFDGERVERRAIKDGDAYALGSNAITLRFDLRPACA